MSEAIQREDCWRCDGSGQIVQEAYGHTGYVECPDCDNIPAFALPDDPPENPKERLDEIQAEKEALRERKEAWGDLEKRIREATDTLQEAAESDFFQDGQAAVLDHLAGQVSMVVHGNYDHGYSFVHGLEQLNDEEREIERYLDVLENRGESA